MAILALIMDLDDLLFRFYTFTPIGRVTKDNETQSLFSDPQINSKAY